LQTEEFEFEGRTRKKQKMIFPRFHQLDAVRKITTHARENGTGHNYRYRSHLAYIPHFSSNVF